MAKRNPFTAQQERLDRLIKNLQNEVAAIKGIVDTDRSIVTAQILKVDDPVSPQIIRVSEEGSLEAGGEPLPWRKAITIEASHTGDTNETELGKITIPADSMGPNGFVRIHCIFYAQFGSGTYFCRVYFDGNKIEETFSTANKGQFELTPGFVWNQDDATVQGSGIIQGHVHVRSAENMQIWAVDTAQDVDITFTGQLAVATRTIYLRFALVEAFFGN